MKHQNAASLSITRRHLGWSRHVMACKLGITPELLAAYECGAREIPVSVLAQVEAL